MFCSVCVFVGGRSLRAIDIDRVGLKRLQYVAFLCLCVFLFFSFDLLTHCTGFYVFVELSACV